MHRAGMMLDAQASARVRCSARSSHTAMGMSGLSRRNFSSIRCKRKAISVRGDVRSIKMWCVVARCSSSSSLSWCRCFLYSNDEFCIQNVCSSSLS